MIEIRQMELADVSAAVELQGLAFPPPFDPDLLWSAEHLARHLDLFSEAQWVAVSDGRLVGSCSNTRISSEVWLNSKTWEATTGGPWLETFSADGTTLYGLDISVHPEFRRLGIGRKFYERRFQYGRDHGLERYGTGCRLPDFLASGLTNVGEYVADVARGARQDRTLTPLLRYGLRIIMTKENYMEDAESRNAAAILEWNP